MNFIRKIMGLFSKKPEIPQITLTEKQEKIREQMEFYLSPSNIESSSFMKGLIEQREDRYCPIATFFTFKRLQALEATEEDVILACTASPDLEVNEAKDMIRTVIPFKPDPRRDWRTIHVEGLEDSETLDSLQEFFRSIFPKVLRIEMRHKNLPGGEKMFSGAVNVELETEEIAEKAVAEGIVYNDKALMVSIYAQFKQHIKQGKPPKEGKKAPKRARK